MSYFAAFGLLDRDELIDADDIATTKGWAAFAEWAVSLGAKDYPDLCYLGEWGNLYAAEDEDDRDVLAALESELRRALRDKPGKPSRSVLSVGARLLLVVEQRPSGAFYLVVTDGTEGDEE
jgi:hypothetical protein